MLITSGLHVLSGVIEEIQFESNGCFDPWHSYRDNKTQYMLLLGFGEGCPGFKVRRYDTIRYERTNTNTNIFGYARK